MHGGPYENKGINSYGNTLFSQSGSRPGGRGEKKAITTSTLTLSRELKKCIGNLALKIRLADLAEPSTIDFIFKKCDVTTKADETKGRVLAEFIMARAGDRAPRSCEVIAYNILPKNYQPQTAKACIAKDTKAKMPKEPEAFMAATKQVMEANRKLGTELPDDDLRIFLRRPGLGRHEDTAHEALRTKEFKTFPRLPDKVLQPAKQ